MLSYIMNGMLSDQSTQEEFRFSVCCSECGNEWTCKNVRFSKAGIKPESEHKRVIYKTLYEKEKEAALNRALAQAEEMFSKCHLSPLGVRQLLPDLRGSGYVFCLCPPSSGKRRTGPDRMVNRKKKENESKPNCERS